MYSSKKPYQTPSKASTRFLSDNSVGPESVFEKPYRQGQYGDMNQAPNTPDVLPDVGGGDQLTCLFSETECEIAAECFAGGGIRVEGGPAESTAGFLDPEVILGALVTWSIDESGRLMHLEADPRQDQNIIKVTFVDGWGIEHVEIIDMTCEVIDCSTDTFTGADGSYPTPLCWKSSYCSQLFTIQNNKLNADLGNSEEACLVLRNTITEINFMATIGYSDLVEVATSGFRLYLIDTDNPATAAHGVYVDALYDGTEGYEAFYILSGVWTSYHTGPRTQDYGNLRVGRAPGGTLNCIYKDGGGAWTTVAAPIAADFLGPVYIMIKSITDATGEVAGNWDNSIVTIF